jgi:hypothetical protein
MAFSPIVKMVEIYAAETLLYYTAIYPRRWKYFIQIVVHFVIYVKNVGLETKIEILGMNSYLI